MGCRLESGRLSEWLLAPAARRTITVLDGEPVREAFAIDEAAVAIVHGMPDLVDQHVVEIEISDRVGRPNQVPTAPLALPFAAEHSGFNELLRARLPGVVLNQGGLDRIEVNCR